jgi:hypothetical protein
MQVKKWGVRSVGALIITVLSLLILRDIAATTRSRPPNQSILHQGCAARSRGRMSLRSHSVPEGFLRPLCAECARGEFQSWSRLNRLSSRLPLSAGGTLPCLILATNPTIRCYSMRLPCSRRKEAS